MKRIIILLGAAGSGKGTQAQMLRDAHDFNYIETGAIFRGLSRDTKLGAQVIAIIESGQLVSDELTCELVKAKLGGGGDILTDGFPRTRAQAEWLVDWAARNGFAVNVVLLDIPRGLALQRIQKRLSQGAGRKDDADPSAVARRLDEYYAKTEPMICFLRAAPSVQFFNIDGTQTQEEVFERVRKVLEIENGKLKMNMPCNARRR